MAYRSYERQPEETDRAWQAYVIFKELGSDRSRAEVARRLGKANRIIEEWGRKWDWPKRIADYDRDMDRHARRAEIDAIKKMKARQAKLALKAQTLIAHTLERRLELIEGDEDRRLFGYLDEKTVASLLKVSTDLERLNRDQPTDIIEKREKELDYSKLSPKELEALRFLHAKLNKE